MACPFGASTPKPHRHCDCVVRHGKGDIVDVVKVRGNCLDYIVVGRTSPSWRLEM